MPVAARIAMFTGSLLILGLIACAILIAVLALGQGQFMYPAPDGGLRPALAGWTSFYIRGEEGSLVAYRHTGRPDMPTVLFLHGNGTGYDGSVEATRAFAERGYGVMVPEYPGYGGNPGSPSEASLDLAADRAYEWLLHHGVDASKIVIYGNSVGTGPAVHIARRPHAALIVVSGVASMVDVVRSHYPIAPGFLVRDQWDNASAMTHVKGPVLIMHARDDRVVPFENGVRLAKAANTQLVKMPTGDHFIAFDASITARLADWLDATVRTTTPRDAAPDAHP